MGYKENLAKLKEQYSILRDRTGVKCTRNHYLAKSYKAHVTAPMVVARAIASSDLFTGFKKIILENDEVAGCHLGLWVTEAEFPSDDEWGDNWIVNNHGVMAFEHNFDHFCPDYRTLVKEGIPGLLSRIEKSRKLYKDDAGKMDFLMAQEITLKGFGKMISQYAETAETMGKIKMAEACKNVTSKRPETFREALQLVFLTHTAFKCQGRYAMALGRMDQYLYSFYRNDKDKGLITDEDVLELLTGCFIKLQDDVVNIAIGGYTRSGEGGVNELSYLILQAVKECNVPGPNLSARIYKDIPDEFLDACLKVIGTGLGYPALMNDEINIPALSRYGYSLEDCRDYVMVGCIENFIAGKQPAWSDGRFNSPKYLEYALNEGRDMRDGRLLGLSTKPVTEFKSMEDLLEAFKTQLKQGAAFYVRSFNNENGRFNKDMYTQPFLSCFCQDCIGRGLDINNGGAIYTQAHGACCMGIATTADSLAAIEKLVFIDKVTDLATVREALVNNFEGYEDLRKMMLEVPKYGNNEPLPDKYACWFVDVHSEIFSQFKTNDGGNFYIAMAANVTNIPAGKELGATPDGRKAGEPVSDAASPMHGRDKKGPTAALLSVSKPDYTKVACGTVLNQKYSPVIFNDENLPKLRALIKVYFSKGGQEIQINSVSRKILKDAMENPENYNDLVVRVSGFSAFYTGLDREVQEDILKRTEHEG